MISAVDFLHKHAVSLRGCPQCLTVIHLLERGAIAVKNKRISVIYIPTSFGLLEYLIVGIITYAILPKLAH